MGSNLAQPSTELFHLPRHKTGKIIKEKKKMCFSFFPSVLQLVNPRIFLLWIYNILLADTVTKRI